MPKQGKAKPAKLPLADGPEPALIPALSNNDWFSQAMRDATRK